MSLLLILAGCISTDSPDTTEADVVVAPGVGGEWDDPEAADHYRAITGTLQQAIDGLAGPGPHLITVQGGVFIEDVVVGNGVDVTIEGAGSDETVIDGSITINGSSGIASVTLRRLAVVNSAYDGIGIGIDVDDAQVFVEQVRVEGFDRGVEFLNADNSYVARSVFQDNKYGVWADDTDNNNLFRSNSIAGLTNYTGLGGTVAFNTLVGNAFGASSQVGFGGALQFGTQTETEVVANNIVVSNFFGINCQNCANDFKSNLVWGNFTNYANDASQQSDDLSLDPVFADPGNFDFRLTVGSPAIDAANGTVSVTDDFQGEGRPSGAALDLGFDEYVQSGFNLQITEVMANVATAIGESNGEYVEIYNAGGSSVDLAGLILTDGDEVDTLTVFNSGSTVLAAGEYAIVIDPTYSSGYSFPGGTTIVTTQDTEVGNGLTTSDRVTLFESDGSTTIATYSYPDDGGDGISMEMVLLAQGDASGNWRPSVCPSGGSPGAAACFPPSGDTGVLVITEVLANALDESTGEFIELYNNSDLEVDAAGLIIDDGTGTDALAGFGNSGTLIPPRSYAVVLDSGYAFQYALPNGITLLTTADGSAIGTSGIANSGEGITLRDGASTISSYAGSFSATDAGNGNSWQRVSVGASDQASSWVEGDTNCATTVSPGRQNAVAGGICTDLVITEVQANPLVEDTQEFVELYNAGFDTVDLSTLTLSDGAQNDSLQAFGGGSTVLNPGEYAVIVDAEYDSSFATGSAVLVTTGDTTLGNSLSVNDELEIRIGTAVLDQYNYPFNPGNGFSVELIDVYASDAAENWVTSTCASGSSPGYPNCATGGTAGGSGTSLYELVISEVMANPLDEDTGEFVEIYNYGSVAIDMSFFVIWDGDEVDTIFDFAGGGTVIGPGEYAVIVDFEYDLFGADPYGLSGGPLVLTTSDTTIGSGLSVSDEVYLFEPGANTLIDSYTFPSNPGNGVSIQKDDLLGGDLGSNWSPTSCANHTAGAANCP